MLENGTIDKEVWLEEVTGGMVASNTLVRNTVPHTYYMLFAGVYILPCLAVMLWGSMNMYEYVYVICMKHVSCQFTTHIFTHQTA